MRILLIGKTGQLGWELCRTLLPTGEMVCVDFPEINLTSRLSIRSTVLQSKPDLVVNAAAYTDVDRAETESDTAMAVNGIAPGILAEFASQVDAPLIHFSTDYVFNGEKGRPYIETDSPDPLNRYGKSKLEGEIAVQNSSAAYLIFRTSWVYSMRRSNFLLKVLSWAKKHPEIKVVDDQTSSPTWARTLAQLTALVVYSGRSNIRAWISENQGVYHLAGSGAASRFDWARQILENIPESSNPLDTRVLTAKTGEFPSPAVRPEYTALSCWKFESTFGVKVPDWTISLKLALQALCTD
jgi:dTDP-4-dehydrorhamnose reductase